MTWYSRQAAIQKTIQQRIKDGTFTSPKQGAAYGKGGSHHVGTALEVKPSEPGQPAPVDAESAGS